MKRCPLCGAAYSDEYRYCERDATLLVEAAVTQPAREHVPDPAARDPHQQALSPGNQKPGLVIAFLIALVSVSLFGALAITVINHQNLEQARLQQEAVARERASAQALAVRAQQTAEQAEAARIEAKKSAQQAEQRAELAEEELDRQRAALASQQSVQAEQNTVLDPAPTPEAVATITLTEQSVDDVMNRWLAAQNNQDFAMYQNLYAEDFIGAKRTPTKTKTYRRAGWLADRRRLFDHTRRLNVRLDNKTVTLHSDWAEVSFDQYFRSQTYSDWGPKVIRVRLNSSGPQIFYEELLVSHRL